MNEFWLAQYAYDKSGADWNISSTNTFTSDSLATEFITRLKIKDPAFVFKYRTIKVSIIATHAYPPPIDNYFPTKQPTT